MIDDNCDEENIELEKELQFIIQKEVNQKQHYLVKNKIDQALKNTIDSEKPYLSLKITNDVIIQNKMNNLSNNMEQHFMANKANLKRKQTNIFSNQDSLSSEYSLESLIQNEEILKEYESKKRQKTNAKEQIKQKQYLHQECIKEKEPFQINQFSFSPKKKTYVFQEKCHSFSQENREYFQQSEYIQTQTLGIKIHAGIRQYLESKKQDKLQLLLKGEDVDLIINQVDNTTKYLNFRGMKNFRAEIKIYYNDSYKIMDYIAYNNEQKECIIVDWKFSDLEVRTLIKKNEKHFQEQIIFTQNYFKNQFQVTLLIIPLKHIHNLKFKEYTIHDFPIS